MLPFTNERTTISRSADRSRWSTLDTIERAGIGLHKGLVILLEALVACGLSFVDRNHRMDTRLSGAVHYSDPKPYGIIRSTEY